MQRKLTEEEIDRIFRTEDGKYVDLVIPEDFFGPELDLSDRPLLSLSIDEIVRVKKYAQSLYENMATE